MRMKWLLINQFYPPAAAPTGRLLCDLAHALIVQGHEVTVIASAESYQQGANAGRMEDGSVRVLRLGQPAKGKLSLPAKLWSYGQFYRLADRALAEYSAYADAIVSLTTPPFIGALAAKHAARRRIPFYLWCMDLYPEALVANGNIRFGSAAHRVLMRYALRERGGAKAIISLGPDMTDRLKHDFPDKVMEIPVWSDLPTSPEVESAARALRRQRGWQDDEVILLYSGNMGRAHRVEEFIQLARQLRNSGCRARVVMAGHGPQKAAWIKKSGDLFEFLDYVETGNLAVHLASADIHLVSQQPAWTGIVVPSKFQSACALAKPVIFAGPEDCSVARWIRQHDAGWILRPDNHDDIIKVIADVTNSQRWLNKSNHASALASFCFDKANNLSKMLGVITSNVP